MILLEVFDFYDLDLNLRKLCSYAVYRDEKVQRILCEYFNSLTEKEKKLCEKKAEELYERVNVFGSKYSITKSSIIIANRVKKELGYACFPIIEKVARKGWSVADGTFAWSMPLLKETVGIFNDINSYEPVRLYLLKNSEINLSEDKSFLVLSVEKK